MAFVSSSSIATLHDMPFFQQRLDRFLATQFRIHDANVGNLKIYMAFPPFPASTPNKSVVFLGAYKNITLMYEATRWDDPRTGQFTKITTRGGFGKN